MDNKMDNQEEIRLRLVRPDTSTRTELPVATSGVSAGFPSPADDHLDPPLDLNRELVRNPGATFFARVAGDSMQDDGIADGDLLVVDKSLEAYDGCVAVCFLDGEFTLKRLRMGQGKIVLMPANKRYKPIEIGPGKRFFGMGRGDVRHQKGLKRPRGGPVISRRAISPRGNHNARGGGHGQHATRKNDVRTLRLQ